MIHVQGFDRDVAKGIAWHTWIIEPSTDSPSTRCAGSRAAPPVGEPLFEGEEEEEEEAEEAPEEAPAPIVCDGGTGSWEEREQKGGGKRGRPPPEMMDLSRQRPHLPLFLNFFFLIVLYSTSTLRVRRF